MKAGNYAAVLVTILKERMEGENREDINEQDWSLVVEFIVFLLHVTNRLAFTYIPSVRGAFITMCVFNAWGYLIKRMVHPDGPRREEVRLVQFL